jgi:hypothetical protein
MVMNKKKIIMMLCALWGVYFVLLALLITCLVFSIGEQLLRFFTIIIALFYTPISKNNRIEIIFPDTSGGATSRPFGVILKLKSPPFEILRDEVFPRCHS